MITAAESQGTSKNSTHRLEPRIKAWEPESPGGGHGCTTVERAFRPCPQHLRWVTGTLPSFGDDWASTLNCTSEPQTSLRSVGRAAMTSLEGLTRSNIKTDNAVMLVWERRCRALSDRCRWVSPEMLTCPASLLCCLRTSGMQLRNRGTATLSPEIRR